MSRLSTLQDLYETMLRDVYDAERQIVHSMPKIVKRTTNENLKMALEVHLKDTRVHVSRLERVFQLLDLKPNPKHCTGMEGILKEAVDLLGMNGETSVLDAACIAAVQMVEHYEITAYGTLTAWCRMLNHDGEVLSLLEQTEQEEKSADAALSEMAKNQINAQAMGPVPVLV